MVVIQIQNQPIVYNGQEIVFGDNVATRQPNVNVIIRNSNIPLIYNDQEVIQ
jgi:hypothetical protein